MSLFPTEPPPSRLVTLAHGLAPHKKPGLSDTLDWRCAMRALAAPALYFLVLLGPRLLSATQYAGSVRAADQWVPGATITASQGSSLGGSKVVAYSDDAGRYTMDLAPGIWNIQVEMFGFTAVQKQVTIG